MLPARSLTKTKLYPVIIATIVAFCSIVYELLLAQTYATMLGNSVLRYSITIGLFLFALGIGSFLYQRRDIQNPARRLLQVELALTVVGSLSPLLVISTVVLAQSMVSGTSQSLGIVCGHAWIILIGVLSGFEIPLLIQLNKNDDQATAKVLLWDYIGSFVGSIAFALVIYQHLGLIYGAAATAALNLCAAAMLLPLITRGRGQLIIGIAVAFSLIATTALFESQWRTLMTKLVVGGF